MANCTLLCASELYRLRSATDVFYAACIEASGQLHIPTALLSRKEPPVHNWIEAWSSDLEKVMSKINCPASFTMFILCVVTKLEAYLTSINALFYICSYNLLHSFYMFRRYITPSSGSWHQCVYNTCSNKKGQNRLRRLWCQYCRILL
jgi:hypothetical protein